MKQKLLILAVSVVITLSSVNAESILNPQMEAQATEAFQNLNTQAPEEVKQCFKLWYNNYLSMLDLFIKYADLAIQNPDKANNNLVIELFNEMAPIAMDLQSKTMEICLDASKRNRIDQFEESFEGKTLNGITGSLDYILQNLLATLCDNSAPLSLEERRAAVIELKNYMLTLKDLVE